jgi:hypothetical protein
MLYREIIAVCSETHTKHINTLCGQNVELLHVKPGGTCSNRWALGGSLHTTVWIRMVDKNHSSTHLKQIQNPGKILFFWTATQRGFADMH